MKKITIDTIVEMAGEGITNRDHFLLTDSFFIVKYNGLIHTWLKANNYKTDGMIVKEEIVLINYKG